MSAANGGARYLRSRVHRRSQIPKKRFLVIQSVKIHC